MTHKCRKESKHYINYSAGTTRLWPQLPY